MFSADLGRTLGSTERLQDHLSLELGTEVPSRTHSHSFFDCLPCLVPLSKFWGALQNMNGFYIVEGIARYITIIVKMTIRRFASKYFMTRKGNISIFQEKAIAANYMMKDVSRA